MKVLTELTIIALFGFAICDNQMGESPSIDPDISPDVLISALKQILARERMKRLSSTRIKNMAVMPIVHPDSMPVPLPCKPDTAMIAATADEIIDKEPNSDVPNGRRFLVCSTIENLTKFILFNLILTCFRQQQLDTQRILIQECIITCTIQRIIHHQAIFMVDGIM